MSESYAHFNLAVPDVEVRVAISGHQNRRTHLDLRVVQRQIVHARPMKQPASRPGVHLRRNVRLPADHRVRPDFTAVFYKTDRTQKHHAVHFGNFIGEAEPANGLGVKKLCFQFREFHIHW